MARRSSSPSFRTAWRMRSAKVRSHTSRSRSSLADGCSLASRSSRPLRAASARIRSTLLPWVTDRRYERSDPRSGSNRSGRYQSWRKTSWATSSASAASASTRRDRARTAPACRRYASASADMCHRAMATTRVASLAAERSSVSTPPPRYGYPWLFGAREGSGWGSRSASLGGSRAFFGPDLVAAVLDEQLVEDDLDDGRHRDRQESSQHPEQGPP